MASLPRTCAICPASLDPRNRTGYCFRHHNHSPEKRAKISASLKRGHLLHPEWREVRQRAARVAAQNPENRERRARLCRERRLWEKGVAALTPESRAKAAATQSANRMAWCPPHLRAEARRLNQSQKIPASEVRAIILEQHEAELRRFRQSIGYVEPEPEPGEPTLNPSRMPHVVKGQTDASIAAEIIAAIAFAFGFGPAEIVGSGRRRNVIPARQTCCFVLARLGNSYAQVGRWLGGRDHSTVIHACQQFEISATPAMRELAERMIGGAA